MTTLVPRSPYADRRVPMAFAVFVLAIGGASVAVRIAYVELAPFWTACARFGLGALAFWAIVAYKRIPLPSGRALLGAVIYGVVAVGLAFVLIAWGLVATPASLYQILMAMIPLLTLFLSAVQGVEGITRRGLFGTLLAVAGIAVTVGGASAVSISIPHVIAILVAAAFIAEGAVLIKRFPPNPPVLTNAISMTIGTVILGIASLSQGEPWIIPAEVSTWVAFIYLSIMVSVVAFVLYMFVLGNWSASNTSYGFVLAPLVTVIVAATLTGETITVNFLIGSALVLVGVVVGALLPSKEKPEAVKECKDRAGQVLPHCV